MSGGKEGKLKKELGVVNVFALATGTTLSAGFFLLPGLAVAQAGPAVVLAYLIAAIPLIPAMFSKVEMATAMPRAGGAYYFLDRSMGPLVGTIGGMGIFLALCLKTSFALVGMGAYLNLLMPELPATRVAVALALVFGGLNLVGAKNAALFQILLVIGLLFMLGGFILHGAAHVQPMNFEGFFDKGADSILATAGLVYVSYIGMTKVVSLAEEVKNPERNLPLGIFIALGVSLFVYIAGTIVMVGVIPREVLENDYTPVATAARAFSGQTGVVVISIAALLAFFSVANAGILSASRYPLAMGRDQLLPSWTCRMNKRGIPTNGVYLSVGLVLVFLLLFDPLKIAKLASSFQLMMFALNCLAVIVMREAKIDSYDPGFKSPWYPWMQIVGIIAPIWLIAQMGWLSILFSFGMVAASVAWYFRVAHGRVERTGAMFHIFERLGRRRFEGLDTELRGILKEKGLRDEDPFDEIVARSFIIDAGEGESFESTARQAAKVLGERLDTDPDHILEGFLRGTRIGATPVTHGMALPHIRLPGVEHPEMVIVRALDGMEVHSVDDFGEKDQNELIRAVFFLVSSEENPGQHLRILAQVAGRVDDEGFLDEWLTAANEQDLKEVLLRNDRYLALKLELGEKTSELIGLSLGQLQFPDGCLVAIIRRGELTFVPRSTTELQEDDRLTIIGDPAGILELGKRFAS